MNKKDLESMILDLTDAVELIRFKVQEYHSRMIRLNKELDRNERLLKNYKEMLENEKD
jgi:peptidoglycan hydrolase CwlO-like protein